jgi:acyl transferase domain-containing protein
MLAGRCSVARRAVRGGARHRNGRRRRPNQVDLCKTFGEGSGADERCVVGSAKAAIGHLEAAAGVAGVIKAALCLQHGEIPPQANLRTPNSKIPFEELGLRLPRQREAMPGGDGPIYVGVNSFGYGGTNAHVILEDAAN